MVSHWTVRTRELPQSLQDALASVGYHRPDIAIEVAERTRLCGAYGDGYCAFAVGVNVNTGARQLHKGSRGGGNPYCNAIVDAQPTLDLPPGRAVILGLAGGGRPVSARIVVGPGTMNPQLLAPVSDVTDKERKILAVYGGIKGGHRDGYLRRLGATPAEIDSLIARGFLSRNKAGATAITTAGKNARGKEQPF